MTADVAMFRAMPSVGLGQAWHVIDRRAGRLCIREIWCERTTTSRAKLTTIDKAVLKRRCRRCLVALREAR
jgi:hypothetical protein